MRRMSFAAAFAILGIGAALSQATCTAAVPATYSLAAEQAFGAEPSEQQMRLAFEHYLSALVNNTLVLVAQTGGQEAVRKVQQNGNDRFELRSFHKLQCQASTTTQDYLCDFVVDVTVATGAFQRTMRGHFVSGANGLAVADAN